MLPKRLSLVTAVDQDVIKWRQCTLKCHFLQVSVSGCLGAFSVEERVLVEMTSPSFRILRSFLCDSEKNGLFTAFTLMMKTLLCYESIIYVFCSVSHRKQNRQNAVLSRQTMSSGLCFLPVPVKEENRTKCSREYLDPIHIEYERDNKNVKMRSSSICIHPLIFYGITINNGEIHNA